MAAYSAQKERHPLAYLEGIQWNDEKHTLVICNRVIALTKIQYRLMLPLRYGKPVTYSDLAFVVYRCTLNNKVRIMLDKHIERIRCKLSGTGIYVYCVLGYGYMLLPEIW